MTPLQAVMLPISLTTLRLVKKKEGDSLLGLFAILSSIFWSDFDTNVFEVIRFCRTTITFVCTDAFTRNILWCRQTEWKRKKKASVQTKVIVVLKNQITSNTFVSQSLRKIKLSIANSPNKNLPLFSWQALMVSTILATSLLAVVSFYARPGFTCIPT